MAYSFLSTQDLIQKVSPLSRSERYGIQYSHIVNEDRAWICDFWSAQGQNLGKNLQNASKMTDMVKNKRFLLSLVELVQITVNPVVDSEDEKLPADTW